MKVLHIGKYYYPYHGGMESVVQDICEGLASSGHEIEVLCSNESTQNNNEKIHDVLVRRIPRFGVLMSQPIIPMLFLVMRAIAKKYDIVHVHSPNPMAELATLFLPKNIPVIVTYHSDVVRQKFLLPVYGVLLKAYLRRANKIIVATPNHITYSKFLPEFKEKCQIVPFGLSMDHFSTEQEVETHTENLLKTYGKYALFVGRLVGYKGIDVLIKAAKDLDRNIVIVGSGPLENELKELAKAEGLSDKIHILGKVDDLNMFTALYKACEFFVLPSISPNENFGIVQLEAMYHSKAVITTDLESGVPCVGVRGKTSLIVDPGNAEQLSKAMSMLFSNPELSKKMGEAGKKRFKEKYTLELMTKNHLSEYEKTLHIQDIINKARKAA